MGCPQGGILSFLIWNIVFDSLLNNFNQGPISCIGYTDDGSLITHGNNLELMYTRMNKALGKVVKWANSNGLEISTAKTVAMIFTHKHESSYKLPEHPLRIYGKPITLPKEIKYLGWHLTISWPRTNTLRTKWPKPKNYSLAYVARLDNYESLHPKWSYGLTRLLSGLSSPTMGSKPQSKTNWSTTRSKKTGTTEMKLLQLQLKTYSTSNNYYCNPRSETKMPSSKQSHN